MDGDVEDAVAKDRFVTFKTDGGDFYVQCFFGEAWDAELTKLPPGKPAKICGRCTGETGGNVVLKDCFFPEAVPALLAAKKEREAEREARDAEAKKKQEAERVKEQEQAETRKKNADHLQRKIEAWDKAKDIVTSHLKSPSTASFGGFFGPQGPEACVNWMGEPATYQVHGWVDSQNGFGATVRADFLLALEYKEDVGWVLIERPTLEQR